MNKHYFSFIIYLPLILQLVTFNYFNTGFFVLSCKSAAPRTGKNLEEIRIGKNLQIFKTYKKRPTSDASQENRIVKTLVFPENYTLILGKVGRKKRRRNRPGSFNRRPISNNG